VNAMEHRVSISGRFEPVAMALSSISSITVVESTEAHVLFSTPSGAAALARATDRLEEEVEVVIIDDHSGDAAGDLVELLLDVLDYKVVLSPVVSDGAA
jgi:D-alanine-D-alanine ligase-like ATP-grasp enzyme